MSSFDGTGTATEERRDPAFQLAPSEGDGPNMQTVLQAFEMTVSDNQPFVDQCRLNYETRYAIWNGQSADGKKHSREGSGKSDPTPWDGASDLRVYMVDAVIRYKLARYGLALKKANMVAVPVNGTDVERAEVVGNFLRWLVSTQVPHQEREAELLGNYILEKGIGLMGVFWETIQEKTLKTLKLDDFKAKFPQLDVDTAIKHPALQDKIAAVFEEIYGVSGRKAKTMLRELKKDRETTVPVLGPEISRPVIRAFCLDRDVFVPSWATDIETAPYIFRVEYFSAEQLRSFVRTEDWDADWVEEAIKKCRGKMITTVPDSTLQPISRSFVYIDRKIMYTDLVGVVYSYQRLSDEDGVPGIYLTIFNPFITQDSPGKGYAKFGLLGYQHGMYPFVKFPREFLSRKFHDTRGVPEPGKSWQDQIKAHRDSRIDAASIAIMPPIMYPLGRPPTRWGPGARVPERRPGEYHHADHPMGDSNTEESESILVRTFNEYEGVINPGVDDPSLAASIGQYEIDKYLQCWTQVYRMVWKLWQQYGDAKQLFRVTGLAKAPMQVMEKGDPQEDYQVMLSFDVQSLDQETQIQKFEAIAKIKASFDSNGQIDTSKLIPLLIQSIDPAIAEQVVLPADTGAQQVQAQVQGDLTQMYAGIDKDIKLGTPPQLGMQVIQKWMQSPDVQQRMMGDPSLQERVQKYAKQLQFQATQQNNAKIGRFGA
jgi:hypothetical protein